MTITKHNHKQRHTPDNSEMQVSLQSMHLDWGRKPDYSEEPPEAYRKHVGENASHIQGGGWT